MFKSKLHRVFRDTSMRTLQPVILASKKSGLSGAHTNDKRRDIDRSPIRMQEVQFASSDPTAAARMYPCKPNNVGFGDMQIVTSNGTAIDGL